MLLACCCSKSRKDGETLFEGPESKIKNINRILLEFVTEESKIGLKEVPCINMIEQVLVASNKGEVPKRDIIKIYKSCEVVNQASIKNFLIQDFFFVDNTRQKYDFNKIVLFNLLYSGGKEVEKANFLFNIIENAQSTAVHNHSQKLISTLENITYISTIAVGEILNSVRRFTSDNDDMDFQELLSLFATNANMLREFSNHISSMYLFPTTDDRQYLQRKEFLKRMEDCSYLLIKPNEVRKKYTDYVWQNKARALLPSRLMRRGNRDYEENKNNQSFTDSEHPRSQRGTFNRNQASSKKFQQRQMEESQVINQMRQEQQQRQDKIDRFMPSQPSPYNYSNNDNLNRKNSDISLAIYRYDDKSNNDSNNSPQNRYRHQNSNGNRNGVNDNQYNSSSKHQKNNQQYASSQPPQQNSAQNKSRKNSNQNLQASNGKQPNQKWEETDRGVSPQRSPASRNVGRNGSEKDLQNKVAQTKRGSNRESSDTMASLQSTKSKYRNLLCDILQIDLQKYPNVQIYLKEMFGEQFVNFVVEMQDNFDNKKQKYLQQRLQNLKNLSKLEFPDYNNYPYHIREIFEYYNAIIHKEDLIEFSKGRLFRENIINVYLKILEKINLIRQSQYNFQRATTRNSIDLYSQTNNQTPTKILYFNTSFSRKLNNEQSLKDCLNQLQNFFKFDQVVMPFFIDEEDDQRALIVSIKVANYQVDLYDREREHDNHDISDTVLHLLDLSSRLQDVEFNEDQIDGGVEGICVQKDEDMIVAMCYIAECITFNKPIDLEVFNVNLERQRILNVFLSLLEFE